MKDQSKIKKQLTRKRVKRRQRIPTKGKTEPERRRVRDALQESEDTTRVLLNATNDSVLLIDKTGTVLALNEIAAKRFGKSISEILGSCIYNLLPPDVTKSRKIHLDEVIRTGKSKYFEDERQGIVFANVLYPILDRKGKVVKLAIYARDITEHKQWEDTLRKEKERAQKYLDIAGVILVVINTDQKVILINRKGCEILGYKEEEMIGRNWFDHFIPERDRSSVKTVFAKLVATEIEPVEYFENSVLTKSGMEKIIAWHNTIITDEKGRMTGTVSSGEDVTERKKAEEALKESEKKYRQVVENATEIIYTTDIKGNFRYANPTALKVVGYSLEELQRLNYLDLVVPEYRDRLKEVYGNQFRARQATTYVEFPFFNKFGEVMWFGQSASLMMEGERIIGFQIIARDITERKRAEDALRESEERYRTLVETSPDAITLLDLNLNIVMTNWPALTLYGYDNAEEVMGQSALGFIAPEDRPRAVEDARKMFETGNIVNLEYTLLRKDGVPFPGEVRTSLILNAEKKPLSIICVSRDVTERKQAEEAHRVSEKRFKELFDEAPVGYFEYDDRGQITNVNRTELEMLGYTAEEMIGHPVWKFVVEEDIAHHQILSKLAGTMPPARDLERTYRRKDGTTFPALVQDRLLRDAEGSIKGLRATVQDITERKQTEEALRSSEEKYRTILENIEDGYYELDIAGNFTFFNDSICRIYGYPREELMGMNDRQYADQENAKELFQTFNKVYRTGEPTKGFDWEIIRKDGTKRNIEASVSLMKDSSGSRIGFRGIVRDVTERKQIEQEKANLEEKLRQSQKIEAIGRLAGGIAHDFNNLLTVIKGYSQLSLVETKEGSPLKENLEEIKKAAEKAADLTRQLLAFSRRQILEMKVLDLNSLLMDLDKMLRRLIGEDIELITLLADDLGRVKTDPGWVEQIIMNLAVNARDAMPKGGKLTIETANVELDEAYARGHIAVKPGRYVMLSVSDTGVGMTPEVRQQVFEPFFTTKEKGKGTGLGLSTVYGIVKQSGGNIWVYSELGQGTTFKIYLPRVDEPLEELRERVVKEELPEGKETVLVVEDEEAVRQLAVRILKRQGYKVLEAPHGVDALLLCKEHKEPIHLILTDVVMPGMSGRQLVDRCSQMRQDFKALYMSGYTDNAIVQHGVLVEGINYIQKPFTVDALARKVREVLDK